MPRNESSDKTEIYKRSSKSGRKISQLAKVIRQVQAARQWSIVRFMAAAPEGAANGFYYINQVQASSGNALYLPLYLFDLDATPNVVVAGTYSVPYVAYQLNATSELPAASMVFAIANGTDVSGVGTTSNQAANTWVLENSMGIINNSLEIPNRSAYQEWYDIKLRLYGALTRAVRYQVELITLHEPYYAPDFNVQVGEAGNSDAKYMAEHNVFWQSMVKPFVSSPINTQTGSKYPKRLGYRTIKTIYNGIIQPKLTTEPYFNASTFPQTGGVEVPHIVNVHHFHRLERKVRYDWQDLGVINMTTNATTWLNAMGFQQSQGYTHTVPHFRTRQYLMVRATSPVLNVGSFPRINTKVDPSFDINIRKKFVSLE
jgi:hypothetical protein